MQPYPSGEGWSAHVSPEQNNLNLLTKTNAQLSSAACIKFTILNSEALARK